MARIEYVGHATVLVDLDGVRVLTDPLLRNRVAHLRRVAPLDARSRRAVDAVLISHAHYDHLDIPSLEKLGKSLPVVVPRGLARLLRKRRFEAVVEVEVGETFRIGDLDVRAVPAEHDGSRGPFGASATPLGYVITGSRSVYFAGDTDLFDGMGELAPVDVALLPIWGWGPGLGAGHLDPKRAAAAVALIRPELVVPIHWGTYFPIHLGLRGAPAFTDLPPAEFVTAVHETAPGVPVRVLRPGQSLDL
ncbi:MAG: MBL fold metallo-hydrolase [Thermoleophilia bacterium]|nr:MBL fold metallo-hydrolase [Thermoleophilia bacterium]